MARSKKSALNRRNFLRSAGAGAALAATGRGQLKAQQPQTATPRVTAPNAATREAETGTPPSSVEVLTNERPGSDFIVDVLKSLGFEYVCNPKRAEPANR